MKPIEMLSGLTTLILVSVTPWWTGVPPPRASPTEPSKRQHTAAAMTVPLSLPNVGHPLEPAMERLKRLVEVAPGPVKPPPPVPARTRTGKRKPRLVIDAGHGGHDRGASGKRTTDKAIALSVTLELKKLFDADPRLEVHYTRLSDRFYTLDQRADLTRQVEADGFVSLHANGVPRKKTWVNGVEVFHHAGGESALLATLLERGIVRSTRQNTRGVRSRGYHVLRHAHCAAALIELGFVSNRSEEALMMTPAWRRKVARAIHQSLIEWLQATGRLPGGKPTAASPGAIADAAPTKTPSQG